MRSVAKSQATGEKLGVEWYAPTLCIVTVAYVAFLEARTTSSPVATVEAVPAGSAYHLDIHAGPGEKRLALPRSPHLLD